MKKLKAFSYVFVKSLSSISYYRDVIKTNLSFSVKYIVVLTAVTALITTISASVVGIPKITKDFGGFVQSAKSFFPDDLVFSIEKGEWSVNRPEPFIVTMPKTEGAEVEEGEETPANIIVFYHEGTIDDLKNLDTLVIVNKSNVIYRDGESISVYPIKNMPDSRLDKGEFNKLVSSLDSIVKALPVFLVIMTLLFTFGGSLFLKVFYFLGVSTVVWIIAKITGAKLGYKNSAQVTMHSSTLPVLVGVITELIGVGIPFLMWFPLLNIILATIVLHDISKAGKGGEALKPTPETPEAK